MFKKNYYIVYTAFIYPFPLGLTPGEKMLLRMVLSWMKAQCRGDWNSLGVRRGHRGPGQWRNLGGHRARERQMWLWRNDKADLQVPPPAIRGAARMHHIYVHHTLLITTPTRSFLYLYLLPATTRVDAQLLFTRSEEDFFFLFALAPFLLFLCACVSVCESLKSRSPSLSSSVRILRGYRGRCRGTTR